MFSNFEHRKVLLLSLFSSFGEQDEQDTTFNTISFIHFEDQLAITCHQFTISNSLRLFRQHNSIWKQLMKTKDKTCCNSKAMGIHFAHNIRVRYSNFIFEIQSSFVLPRMASIWNLWVNLQCFEIHDTEYLFSLTAKLPKWFGERPGKKSGDPDSPDDVCSKLLDFIPIWSK